MFLKYGLRAIRCWVDENDPNRLQIGGALLLILIAQILLLPMEGVRLWREGLWK